MAIYVRFESSVSLLPGRESKSYGPFQSLRLDHECLSGPDGRVVARAVEDDLWLEVEGREPGQSLPVWSEIVIYEGDGQDTASEKE